MSLEFDASDFFRHVDLTNIRVHRAAVAGVQDSMDDLKRIATDIAPVKTGVLRASGNAIVDETSGNIVGEVTFSATNTDGNGRFNYAYWTHEKDYQLGEQSQAAPGTDGYEVNNKYLERPLKGESEKYVRWISEEIARELD